MAREPEAPREAPLSVRMLGVLKQRVTRAAKRNKVARNAWIVQALTDAVEKDEARARAARRQVTPRMKGTSGRG